MRGQSGARRDRFVDPLGIGADTPRPESCDRSRPRSGRSLGCPRPAGQTIRSASASGVPMSLWPWKTNTGVPTNAATHFGPVKSGCIASLNWRAGGVGDLLMPQHCGAVIRRRGPRPRQVRTQSEHVPRRTRHRDAPRRRSALLMGYRARGDSQNPDTSWR